MSSKKAKAPAITELTSALVAYCNQAHKLDLINASVGSMKVVKHFIEATEGGALALIVKYPELQEFPAPRASRNQSFVSLAQQHIEEYLSSWVYRANAWLKEVKELDYQPCNHSEVGGYEKYVAYYAQVWQPKAFAYLVEYAASATGSATITAANIPAQLEPLPEFFELTVGVTGCSGECCDREVEIKISPAELKEWFNGLRFDEDRAYYLRDGYALVEAMVDRAKPTFDDHEHEFVDIDHNEIKAMQDFLKRA